MIDDLFDLETVDVDVSDFHRDPYGRPEIIMPDGTVRPHARVSTVAKLASNQEGLGIWSECQTALAMAKSPDIAGMIADLDYDRDRGRLRALVREARVRHGSTVASNWGTVIHLNTELGATRAFLPEHVRYDALSYDRELKRTGFEPIESEVRVVNSAPDLMVAGTFDTLYRVPYGVVVEMNGETIDLSWKVIVGDTKSSEKKLRHINACAQIAGYATGERYDVATGERSPIHPDLEPRVGMSCHIPLGHGRTEFGFLDLTLGRQLLAAARVIHRMADGRCQVMDVPSLSVMSRLYRCGSPYDVVKLWRSLTPDEREEYPKEVFSKYSLGLR